MKTAQKAIRLLKQFSREEQELGVADLSRRLQMDRAAVHRLLQSLRSEGVIQQNERTRRYALGPAVVEIAAARAGRPLITQIAQRHLQRLRDRTGEGAALTRTDGAVAICVTMVECKNAVRVVYEVGERIPLHCSASGLILLAYIEPDQRAKLLSKQLQRFTAHTETSPKRIEAECQRILREGTSYTADTYLEGVRSVAAPVRDQQGQVVAAVAVSVPTLRLPDGAIAKLRAEILDCAAAITDDLASQY